MQTVYITSHYAWEQNDKIIILHVPVPNANEIKNENCTLDVQARSIQLDIVDHQGVNYNFKISNLCGDLVPAEFGIKFKPNKVILHLQKKYIGKHWNDVKVKKVSDVFSQVQRQIDASQDSSMSDLLSKDMEERTIDGYGPSSIQDVSPVAKSVPEQRQ